MSFFSDLKILYHIILKPIRGETHRDRLESFYGGQAEAYDRFRKKLLHGREELFRSIPVPEGGIWMDLGGGTGSNIESISDRLHLLRKAYVVDLSDSLLEVGRKRADEKGWSNVEFVSADATEFVPPEGEVDVVTFSYSLTMIPDWFRAIDHALDLLKPGGTLGAVDFYVSRRRPDPNLHRHSWLTRTFWPTWFAWDNVFLSPDHLPYLRSRFETVELTETNGRVPYLLGCRVPHYRFVGRKSR